MISRSCARMQKEHLDDADRQAVAEAVAREWSLKYSSSCSASSHRCSPNIQRASSEGMRVFLSALHGNTILDCLALTKCGLDCEAALVIGDVLATTSTLSTLL